MDFSFPTVAPSPASNDHEPSTSSRKRVPLTAHSTVTHIPSDHVVSSIFDGKEDNTRNGRAPVEMASSHLDWMKLNLNDKPSEAKDATRWISKDELASHRSPTDAWISIKGRVYDITSYLQFHPGGAKILLAASGRDATVLFDKYHRWIDASYLLDSKAVGKLLQDNETRGLDE